MRRRHLRHLLPRQRGPVGRHPHRADGPVVGGRKTGVPAPTAVPVGPSAPRPPPSGSGTAEDEETAVIEPPTTAPRAVDVRETHIGVVFLVGDRAYKAKKPVTTDYLDFGTPQRRLAACRREVELNRRLAPDVYATAPVARAMAAVADPCPEAVPVPTAGTVADAVEHASAAWRRAPGVQIGTFAPITAALDRRG